MEKEAKKKVNLLSVVILVISAGYGVKCSFEAEKNDNVEILEPELFQVERN